MARAPRLDRTLLVVKPDGVARGVIGRIITRVEEKGLFMVAIRMLSLDEKTAREMYAVHEGKDFYEPLVAYITSGPVVAMILEGRGVINTVRALCGPTFGSAAPPGTIRGDLAVSNRYNIVHASDSKESFDRERPIFFADGDIAALDMTRLNWIYAVQDGGVV